MIWDIAVIPSTAYHRQLQPEPDILQMLFAHDQTQHD